MVVVRETHAPAVLVAVTTGGLLGLAALGLAGYLALPSVKFVLSGSGSDDLGRALSTVVSYYLIGAALLVALFGWIQLWAAWASWRGSTAALAATGLCQGVGSLLLVVGPAPRWLATVSVPLLAAGIGCALLAWRDGRRREAPAE